MRHLRFGIALTIALVPLLLALTPTCSTAELDGRTDGMIAGDREDSGQTVRLHLYGEQGTCLRVITAGVRSRNALPSPPASTGLIALPQALDPAAVVWAGLYWVILGDTEPTQGVQLNGSSVTAEPLPVTASPCWPEAYAFPYFAEVTNLIVAGENEVQGLEDSGVLATSPESEGASLVVIYEDETSTACEIIVTDGNDLLNQSGQWVDHPLPITCGDALAATLTFIGADGQTGTHGYAPDDQSWNGVPLGTGDDWNASDPPADGAEPDLSWDTDGWQVVTGDPNIASSSIPSIGGPGDCVNWIATVVEVDPQSCIPTRTERSSWGKIKSIYR